MQIGFIDFSKEERSKVLSTLKLLGMQNAVDELGIGVVRDSYANILFPGISIIQTRAKYFVLIPYILKEAEKQNFLRSSEVHKWVNAFEDKMVSVLINNSDSKETGIIGSDALKQKRSVKMRPSSIYWSGMRTFEIVKDYRLSFSNACDIVFAKSKRNHEKPTKIKGETFDDENVLNGDSTIFSPLVLNYDLEKDTSINLTFEEAQFLEDKITKSKLSGGSLLSFLIENRLNFNSFREISPEILPSEIKTDYLLAMSFADFIYGAHLRYNVIFSAKEDADMIEDFNAWKEDFDSKSFQIDKVFDRISCNNSTRKFCEDFLQCILNDDMDAMDELIIAREKAVKQDRSKLNKPTEYHYSPVHNYRLNYRFGSAKTIISDTIKGLGY